MEEELIAAKEYFVFRFNPERTKEEALNKAVNRSVQRAYDYTPGTTQVRTAEIRKFWKELLCELCEKYTEV